MAAKRKLSLEEAVAIASDPATDPAALERFSQSRDESVALAALGNPNLPFSVCAAAIGQAYDIRNDRNIPIYTFDPKRFRHAVAAALNPQWPFEVLTNDVVGNGNAWVVDQVVARVFLAYLHELVLTILSESVSLPTPMPKVLAERLRLLWQKAPAWVESRLFSLSSHNDRYTEEVQEAYMVHRSFLAIGATSDEGALSPSDRIRWCIDSYLAIRAAALYDRRAWISERFKRDGRHVNVAENRFLHAVCGWFGEEVPPLETREMLL